jgi:benzoate 4-monooxygenase
MSPHCSFDDSDTTSKYAREMLCSNNTLILFHSSSCAITYHLAASPSVQHKLQAELDTFLGSEDLAVSTYDQVKHLQYLDAVINEGLRIHSTSALGLPRVVPAGGMEVGGRVYREGAVLSVPSYTIHRDVGVWGEDVETFRPERWSERDSAMIGKTFNPFSYGPR